MLLFKSISFPDTRGVTANVSSLADKAASSSWARMPSNRRRAKIVSRVTSSQPTLLKQRGKNIRSMQNANPSPVSGFWIEVNLDNSWGLLIKSCWGGCREASLLPNFNRSKQFFVAFRSDRKGGKTAIGESQTSGAVLTEGFQRGRRLDFPLPILILRGVVRMGIVRDILLIKFLQWLFYPENCLI